MRGYDRVGSDLHITLADGRIIVLEGYFNADGTPANRLFLSHDGLLNEVSFADGSGSVLFASYGPTEEWGKWSPSDDLIFYNRPQLVEAVEPIAAGSENDVSMLAAGLLGGSSLLGAGAGAAVLGAAALVGAGGASGSTGSGESGGEEPGPIRSVEGGEVTLGGDDLTDEQKEVIVLGTGAQGDTVEVTIGDQTETTTVGEDGTWEVVFEDDTFPSDGDHVTEVVFTDTNGEKIEMTGPNVLIDTTPPVLSVSEGTKGAGEIFNAVEYDGGMVIGGSTEAGATVTVTINNVVRTATGGADGSWSVTYTKADLPTGEYEMPITVVSSDSFGNTTTVTEIIQIDTVPHPLVINTVGGDDVLSGAEVASTVTITGSSNPGAVITVTVAGMTQTVTATSSGSWSLTLPANSFTSGDYISSVTASTVDFAGNPSSTNREFRIDTVNNVTVNTETVETDGVVNFAERSDGVELTGTTDIGSTVMVTLGGISRAATVNADGTWTVTYGASEIPTGERVLAVTAVATDAYGNRATAAGSLDIDTLVNRLESTAAIEGDNVVNAAEASDGFAVTGMVEAGSTVIVTFNGIAHTATVSSTGAWTVQIPQSSIPYGTGSRLIKIDATDAAGNTASITRTITVDTDAPDNPYIETYSRGHAGIIDISIDTSADTVDIARVGSNGSISDIGFSSYDIPAKGETVYEFDSPLADGSHLLVTTEDAAGNFASTYLVFDESTTSVVNLANANLGDFNIEAVDLRFAEESELTITEAQLLALSSNSDALTVYGGVDDMVTITGATLTGTSVDAKGNTFNVYALGEDGTVLIDDDITNVVI